MTHMFQLYSSGTRAAAEPGAQLFIYLFILYFLQKHRKKIHSEHLFQQIDDD